MNDLLNLTNCHAITSRTCSIPQDKLESWINVCFEEKVDLSKYDVREFGSIELFSEKGERGYIFVPKLSSGGDNVEKEKELGELYFNQNLFLNKGFILEDKTLCGFSWSK